MIRTTLKAGRPSRKPMPLPARLPLLGLCKFISPATTSTRISPNHKSVQCIWRYSVHSGHSRSHRRVRRIDAGCNPRSFPVPPWDSFRTNHHTPFERKFWTSSCLSCVLPNLRPFHLGSLIFQVLRSTSCLSLFRGIFRRSKSCVSDSSDRVLRSRQYLT